MHLPSIVSYRSVTIDNVNGLRNSIEALREFQHVLQNKGVPVNSQQSGPFLLSTLLVYLHLFKNEINSFFLSFFLSFVQIIGQMLPKERVKQWFLLSKSKTLKYMRTLTDIEIKGSSLGRNDKAWKQYGQTTIK